MDAKAKEGETEQSMEEILQSIRKIIAEDGDEVKPETAAAASGNGVVGGSDVLELTEMVEEPAVMNGNGAHTTEDILSQIDQALAPEPAAMPAIEPLAPPAPKAKPAAASPANGQPYGQDYIDSLLSKETAAATTNAFKKLQTPEPPLNLTPFPAMRSGATLEDLVTDMLKPMLKNWLDSNLTAIVERVVEREVRKLSH